MTGMEAYKHWRLEPDAARILWLYFDKQNATVNTMDKEVMEEFSSILDNLAATQEYIGLVIGSAKKSGFIAGADVSQFDKLRTEEAAVELLKLGQQIFSKVEALKIPTVAMIEGFCLGGGLELALACRYRVAEEGKKTRLGFPEVRLGIQPGWGGSVRMPRLIGGMEGLSLMLSGHTVSAKAAAKLGIVDAAVPKRHLLKAAKYYLVQNPGAHKATSLQALTNHNLLRPLLAKVIRHKLTAKVNPTHYPAPYQILNNWETNGVEGREAFDHEAQSCGKLFMTETSRNLVRVFFLQERLKSLGKAKEITSIQQHVHVVGGGTMGGDIAAWCALQGCKVTLQDVEAPYLARAMKRAYQLFKEKLKEPHLIQKAMDSLIPDVPGHGISSANVIIEAVIEDLEVKQRVFKEIEQKAKPLAILATNTSSIPLDEINKVMKAPERLVGIHFFNPVAMMQLVEVVKGEKTDKAIVERALSFVRQIDRLPLPILKGSPGFLVNRILFPYMMEAMTMVEEKVPVGAIDKAMTNFGMPIGPIALMDMVGLDVCLSIHEHLGQYVTTGTSPRLQKLVAEKKLGRKTGEGFYQYDKSGKLIPLKDEADNRTLEEIANRLVLRLLNESFLCLREGIVADADLLDAGMIFGTGFAPFRGGPIHYAKSQGIEELFQKFVKQQEARGAKSEAIPSWQGTEVLS
jgi:3-hydroxyacyl-CoA dehydrogenase/enoyl-CoA hydratase/3-hydroxybutyryl-CoA epimerase